MTDLATGRTEAVLPGVSMSEFDLAPDGERITFAALDAEGNSHPWVAPLDRRTPPKQLTSSFVRQISFGGEGNIYFLLRKGGHEFLYSIAPGEAAPRQIRSRTQRYIQPNFALWRLVAYGFGFSVGDCTANQGRSSDSCL